MHVGNRGSGDSKKAPTKCIIHSQAGNFIFLLTGKKKNSKSNVSSFFFFNSVYITQKFYFFILYYHFYKIFTSFHLLYTIFYINNVFMQWRERKWKRECERREIILK